MGFNKDTLIVSLLVEGYSIPESMGMDFSKRPGHLPGVLICLFCLVLTIAIYKILVGFVTVFKGLLRQLNGTPLAPAQCSQDTADNIAIDSVKV